MSEDPKGFDAGDYNLFRYVHNDPLDLTDPMGLNPEVWLVRDPVPIAGRPGTYYSPGSDQARRAPATLTIRDNGKILFRDRCNEYGFRRNDRGELTKGVAAGNYRLLPRGDSWGPSTIQGVTQEQPSITGHRSGLRPGQPDKGYLTPVMMHLPGAPGRPDSKGCPTCSAEAIARTQQAMKENQQKRVETPIHIRDAPVRKAEPVSDAAGSATSSAQTNVLDATEIDDQQTGGLGFGFAVNHGPIRSNRR